ncbi:MAG: hypothetical protein M0Q70_00820 [Dokdonella sp.]|nr:hypothetical protein [Dokdonella sp.]
MAWLLAGCLFMSGLQAQDAATEARVAAQMRAALDEGPQVPAARSAPGQELPWETRIMAEVVPPPAPTVQEADGAGAVTTAPEDGVPFDALARLVGHRVTIVTRGARTHKGVVASANGKQVQLQVRRAGGTATYTLLRDQVMRIETR